MQSIQNVIEDLIKRYLTDKASFGSTQMGFNLRFELFFAQFCRNFAHDSCFSPFSRLHHHDCILVFCQFSFLVTPFIFYKKFK